MASYKHLTLDDRTEIQKGLHDGLSYVQIGSMLGRDPTTVSKEVRAHATAKRSGTRSKPFNPCAKREACQHQKDICSPCNNNTYNWARQTYCSLCGSCIDHCEEFVEEKCRYLNKPSHVCNGCSSIKSCTLEKRVYDAKTAQAEYSDTLTDSRQGINMDPEELRRLDDIISPLIKQGQSIHQICVNNADLIMLDERSIYNYIDSGILTASNIDLPRKIRYRRRRTKKTVRVDKRCHEGRTYDDYLAFMDEHTDWSVVEMDSVESARGSSKVLLTLHFRDCEFMLAYLREANTARSVTDVFNHLYNLLGHEKFCSMFRVILTDRGSEFTDPSSIEFTSDGKRRTHVFYCDPQRSNQKGSIEVTHELIRRVLPKGTVFRDLTQDKVDLMMSHINSYTRKKLNNRSAYQLFSFFYGSDTADLLGQKEIPANNIILKPSLVK